MASETGACREEAVMIRFGKGNSEVSHVAGGHRAPVSRHWPMTVIVINTETDIWCAMCALPVAVTLTYVVETPDGAPGGVYRLTYCESCEPV
jgi:hypothetical protein